jgi:glycosyltransferase involved in cell wall biosynthesis
MILDDCSTDKTRELAQRFLSDSRVRYFHHKENIGIAANWRFGITHCNGAFFCILHDDDTIEPQFVSTLVEPLQRDPELILAFCDHWVTDSKGRRAAGDSNRSSTGYGRDRIPAGRLDNFARVALIDSAIPAGATLFRRELVPPDFVDDGARGAIDMWLLYQCVKSGKAAYYLPERLMNYRVHPHGMSRSKPFAMIEGHLFRYRTLLGDSALADLHGEIRIKLGEVLEWYGMALLWAFRSAEARTAFSEALAIRPSVKARLGWALSWTGALGSLVPTIANSTRRWRRSRT